MQAQIVDAESVGSDHKLEYDYPGVATALQLHLNGKFRLAVEQTRSQLMQVWSPVASGENALSEEATGRGHGRVPSLWNMLTVRTVDMCDKHRHCAWSQI
jgi:hypothetical protein